MRRRYSKSHFELPIIFVFILFSHLIEAKENENETNIVCYAAKNKWVCAPEDQQEIASEKAEKLIGLHDSEVGSSEVVIRSIDIPRFNTINNIEPTDNLKDETNRGSKSDVSRSQKYTETDAKVQLNDTSANNPYVKLWSHQLIGVSTHQNAINYVYKKRLNKDDVLILKTSRANMDWWIVLFGLYKDRQTGIDNAVNLPSNIDPPWLRPLKNLEVKGFVEKF